MTIKVKMYSTNNCPKCVSDKPRVRELLSKHNITLEEVDAMAVPSSELTTLNITSVPCYVVMENGKAQQVIRGNFAELQNCVEGE